ncbi:hypothetical protein [Actinosynnema sp. NPDC020468]|uniref:hypothetical protein n=1 Tax=Actinosynnema sp. NPDC020468 TaxID=3154488 RepID=UPI0033DECAE5
MALPFAAHPAVRPGFERRWARARVPVLGGFAAATVAAVVVAVVVPWDGTPGLGWVLVVLGAAPVAFAVSGAYVRYPGWWGPFTALLGVVQALGVVALSGAVPPGVAVGVVALSAAVAVVWGRGVLFDAGDGAVLGTTLGVRSEAVSVRGHTGRLHVATATFDGEWLRWSVGAGPSGVDPAGGRIPLRDIESVWVVEVPGNPLGPVVAVRTATTRAHLVAGAPQDFVARLDRRLRLLSEPGWAR